MRIYQCSWSHCWHEPSTCRDLCYSSRGQKLFGAPATFTPRYTLSGVSLRTLYHRPVRSLVYIAAKKPDTESQPELEDMADLSSVSKQSLVTGQLCLCGVAILWGSYSPVVRYIYSCPGPPTPAALTAVRTVIQAVALLISDVIVRQQQLTSPQKVRARRNVMSPRVSRNYDSYPEIVGSALSRLSNALHSTSSKLWVAGVELGFWNFCGSTFQALGLQYTSATRGAFLIQVGRSQQWRKSCIWYACFEQLFLALACMYSMFPDTSMQATSLLTPVMAAMAGEETSRGVWLGCCCTLAGTVLITLDHSAASEHGLAAASSLGDVSPMLILLLCMLTGFWAYVHTSTIATSVTSSRMVCMV